MGAEVMAEAAARLPPAVMALEAAEEAEAAARLPP